MPDAGRARRRRRCGKSAPYSSCSPRDFSHAQRVAGSTPDAIATEGASERRSLLHRQCSGFEIMARPCERDASRKYISLFLFFSFVTIYLSRGVATHT